MHPHEWVSSCLQFVKFSQNIGDNWELVTSESKEIYICSKKMTRFKVNAQAPGLGAEFAEFTDIDPSCATVSFEKNEQFLVEYHVVYSVSYQVPVLYLNIQDSRGQTIDLQTAWLLLETLKEIGSKGAYCTLTQMEHPILQRPFLCVHPCKTHEIIDSLPNSKQSIVTFLSTYGPFVKLYLDGQYACI
ncbi:ubiquitin-like-conjugating enzyme ATG10 [Anopheles cruzii]|uniref:ubiquitin-like-conjugating enzyme ATG10 n=1 Tax=Anopheles cruzii TaxID=68878 RepID=UPI0022EC9433|nr:ubiquitin-like-conjugating enzyme ATG10 [Anopheles cruzii]